ncbi:MAG TPA: BrnA antitoxin family protein [Nitrospira sp.]|nr:BrnA antitoxin family protein [Nitrospira sp.]
MNKKRFASTARGRRLAGSVRHIPDSQINFSAIPEATDAELRRMRRVGRPATGMAKQLIAIRLSTRLLDQLRKIAAKQGKPYQTLIHELLERAASHAARSEGFNRLAHLEHLPFARP